MIGFREWFFAILLNVVVRLIKFLERYEKTVKTMHLQFIEPTKRYADIIVPQGVIIQLPLAYSLHLSKNVTGVMD